MIILIDIPDDVVKELHGELPAEISAEDGKSIEEKLIKCVVAKEVIKIPMAARSELVQKWTEALLLSAQDKEFDERMLRITLEQMVKNLRGSEDG